MLLFRSLVPQRRRDHDAELDTAIAGVQLGLDEKRQRWLQFLIAKLELHRRQVQLQAMPGVNGRPVTGMPGIHPVQDQEEHGDG
jgi:hypothetical protein